MLTSLSTLKHPSWGCPVRKRGVVQVDKGEPGPDELVVRLVILGLGKESRCSARNLQQTRFWVSAAQRSSAWVRASVDACVCVCV